MMENQRTDSKPESLRLGKKAFIVGMMLFAITTTLIGLWLGSHDSIAELQTLNRQLESLHSRLGVWRLVLLATLVIGFKTWVKLSANLLKLDEIQQQLALNQRYPITLSLLLIEIVFAQHGLEHVVHWLRRRW